MSDFLKCSVSRLINGALMLCLALSFFVTACSNPGVALNSDVVVQQSASMELGEADQPSLDQSSLDDAISGSGL